MNRKHQIIFIMFIFFNSILFAQDDLEIIKINNKNFPDIEMFLRAEKEIEIKDLAIIENKKRIDFSLDTVVKDSFLKGRSVLFIMDIDADEIVKEIIIKKISKFSETDQVNIGFILNSDTSINFIHFISPEFSSNHFYFINILKQNLFHGINYKLKRRELKKAKKSFLKMNKEKDRFTKNGIIFISKSLRIKEEAVTNIFKQLNEPIYIALTNEVGEKTKNEFFNICTQSGGIFRLTDNEGLEQIIDLFLEDISLQINQRKTKSIRLVFKTKQKKKEKNNFTLKYKEKEYNLFFAKPEYNELSKIDKFLILISAGLFIIIVLLFLKKKRKNTKEYAKESINQKGKKEILKPIEINVKTKGFNKTFFFEKHIISIGRSSTNDIIIPDRTVSGSHAVINKEGDFFKIQDLGSTNGITINKEKVKTQRLKSGDKIKLGGAILVVRV